MRRIDLSWALIAFFVIASVILTVQFSYGETATNTSNNKDNLYELVTSQSVGYSNCSAPACVRRGNEIYYISNHNNEQGYLIKQTGDIKEIILTNNISKVHLFRGKYIVAYGELPSYEGQGTLYILAPNSSGQEYQPSLLNAFEKLWDKKPKKKWNWVEILNKVEYYITDGFDILAVRGGSFGVLSSPALAYFDETVTQGKKIEFSSPENFSVSCGLSCTRSALSGLAGQDSGYKYPFRKLNITNFNPEMFNLGVTRRIEIQFQNYTHPVPLFLIKRNLNAFVSN